MDSSLQELSAAYAGKSPEEVAAELKTLPFFMTAAEAAEDNPQIEALRAMAYEGEPHEIAENFRRQGNECFRERKFKDAIEYYTQALDQKCGRPEIEIACLGNRAQAHLELRNYRQCVLDCTQVLDRDSHNAKAWYRSAKALLAVDRPDEAAACCEQGLAAHPGNEGLIEVQTRVQKRQIQLLELERARRAREEAKEQHARTLKLAMNARGLELRKSVASTHDNPTNLQCELSDPMDASSELMMPLLALYPLAMESDIMRSVGETTTVGTVVAELFAEAPAWANASEYNAENLEAYAPTASGGLARAGFQATLARLFATGNIIMIDGMARLYIVPKPKAKHWLSSWSKDAAVKQLQEV